MRTLSRTKNGKCTSDKSHHSELPPRLPDVPCTLCKGTAGGQLMVKSCLHTFCENCFWKDYVARSTLCTSRRQICCLVCKRPYWQLGLGLETGTKQQKKFPTPTGTSSDSAPQPCPKEAKARSLAKWRKLPPTIDAHNLSRRTGKGRLIPKRPLLEALPLHVAVTLYPGSVNIYICRRVNNGLYIIHVLPKV